MNQVIPRCLGLITADMVADAIRSYTQESSSRIGMIIGTFAAVPYVHLQLEARRRMYPEVPLLVHDDSSKQQERLRKLCAEYGRTSSRRRSDYHHTMGIFRAFHAGCNGRRNMVLSFFSSCPGVGFGKRTSGQAFWRRSRQVRRR